MFLIRRYRVRVVRGGPKKLEFEVYNDVYENTNASIWSERVLAFATLIVEKLPGNLTQSILLNGGSLYNGNPDGKALLALPFFLVELVATIPQHETRNYALYTISHHHPATVGPSTSQ